MKALVINLNSATERMEFQKQQLDSLAIDFQRLTLKGSSERIVNRMAVIFYSIYKDKTVLGELVISWCRKIPASNFMKHNLFS